MTDRHPLAFALYATEYDPLEVIRTTRFAMLMPEPRTTTYGMEGYAWSRRREAYRQAVRRLGKPVDLPADNPFSPSPETARVMNALVRREAALKGGLCLERL